MSRSKYSSFCTFSVVSGTSSTIIKRMRGPLFHAGCIVTHLFWRFLGPTPQHIMAGRTLQTSGGRSYGKLGLLHQTPGTPFFKTFPALFPGAYCPGVLPKPKCVMIE